MTCVWCLVWIMESVLSLKCTNNNNTRPSSAKLGWIALKFIDQKEMLTVTENKYWQVRKASLCSPSPVDSTLTWSPPVFTLHTILVSFETGRSSRFFHWAFVVGTEQKTWKGSSSSARFWVCNAKIKFYLGLFSPLPSTLTPGSKVHLLNAIFAR